MEPAFQEAPRRGRPPRAETAQQDRRRRKGGASAGALDIPEAVRAKYPDADFRWALDQEGRIQKLTQNDDWDVVPDFDSRHAGAGKNGNSIRNVLLMKPKNFIEEDRAEKMESLRNRDQGLLAGPTKEQAVAGGADSYVVPGNKL